VDFDLESYLARIGLATPPAADYEGLRAVHRAQLEAIPFENLDVLMGRALEVDPASVFAKLVEAKRGGYCFENNGLLYEALLALGFRARLLLGRVVYGGREETPPLTHAVVLVEFAEERYLIDAGFGGGTPRAPLPLRHGAEAEEAGLGWQLVGDPEFDWRVRGRRDESWEDLYVFGLERVYPADVALGNHWTSTHPSSHFTKLPTLARHLPQGGRVTLVGDRLTRRVAGEEEVVVLPDAAEVARVAREELGIALDADEAELERLYRPLPAQPRSG
jgi:N-hydroxyarylamine O-acetyltransferase